MIISFDSRKKSYPAFLIVFAYAAVALIFKDRWNYCGGLFLALLLFLGSYGIGKRVSFLLFKTADLSLYFPLGLGFILVCSYAAFSFSTDLRVFYAIWAVIAFFSLFEFPVLNYRIGRSYFWAAPFVLLAFWIALTPAVSYEALSNFLGLPHEYLAHGRMVILSGNVFSAFPPFGQVLNLLFAGLHMESGIQPFLILVYFQIIFVLVALLRWLITEPVISSQRPDDEYQVDLMYVARMELLVVPMLFLPSAWMLVQALSPELLAALFYCSGIAMLVKEFDFLTRRKLLNAAFLLAFALWTKYSIVLYVLLLPALWVLLSGWRLPRENARSLVVVLSVVFLLFLPLLIRNYLSTGDPIYPILAGIFKDGGWTVNQSLALERDFMQKTSPGLLAIVLAPFQLAMQPNLYGPAAANGIVPLLSLVLYPFSRRFRTVNRILIFVLFSFISWIFVFRRFMEFFAPFLFVFLSAYFACRYLYLRSRKILVVSWIICAAISALFLYSSNSKIRFIRPGQNEEQYLIKQADIFPIAQELNRQVEGKTLLIGEARTAYIRRPVDAAGEYYNISAILNQLSQANETRVMEILRRGRYRFVIFNPKRLETLSQTKGIWHFPPAQIGVISSALQRSGRLLQRSGDVSLYEIKEVAW